MNKHRYSFSLKKSIHALIMITIQEIQPANTVAVIETSEKNKAIDIMQ